MLVDESVGVGSANVSSPGVGAGGSEIRDGEHGRTLGVVEWKRPLGLDRDSV